MTILPLLAQADAVKWTDSGMFYLTLVQALVVVAALIVAYRQYRDAVEDGKTKLTLDTFKELSAPEVRDAVDRTSSHLEYEDDWPDLALALTRPDAHPARVQAESDLFTIANLFSKISSLVDGELISAEMLLDEYDEYTLFVCGAISGVYLIYQQPDYRGLFSVARRCRANYESREGRYEHLRTLEIPVDPTGLSRSLTTRDSSAPAPAPPSIRGDATVLRPVTAGDDALLASWFTDPEFVREWGGAPITAAQVARRELGRHDDSVADAYIVLKDGLPIGYVQAWNADPQSGGIDIALVPQARANGTAGDAVTALARHLQNDLKWSRVTLELPLQDQHGIHAAAATGFEGHAVVDRFLLMEFAP